jgi:hypothetical protein
VNIALPRPFLWGKIGGNGLRKMRSVFRDDPGELERAQDRPGGECGMGLATQKKRYQSHAIQADARNPHKQRRFSHFWVIGLSGRKGAAITYCKSLRESWAFCSLCTCSPHGCRDGGQ